MNPENQALTIAFMTVAGAAMLAVLVAMNPPEPSGEPRCLDMGTLSYEPCEEPR